MSACRDSGNEKPLPRRRGLSSRHPEHRVRRLVHDARRQRRIGVAGDDNVVEHRKAEEDAHLNEPARRLVAPSDAMWETAGVLRGRP